jgi:hypothetical protein
MDRETLDNKQRFKLSIAAMKVMAAIGFSTGVVPASNALRHMPVVGEYYNVAGNMLWSPLIALGAVSVAAACEAKHPVGKGTRIALATFAGAAFGLGMNAIAETPAGYEHVEKPILQSIRGATSHLPKNIREALEPHDYSTVDYDDMLAGTALAAGTAMYVGAKRHRMLAANANSEVSGDPGDSNKTAQTPSTPGVSATDPRTILENVPPELRTLMWVGLQEQAEQARRAEQDQTKQEE